MAEAGFATLFITFLIWVPAAWLHLDAEDRGHSAFFWGAIALIPFWNIFVIAAYFIVRSRKDSEPGLDYSRTRIYLHVATLTAWALLAVALLTALYSLLQMLGEERALFEDDREDTLREGLAFAIGVAVLMAPALLVHLVIIRRQIVSASVPARLSFARLQGGLFAVLVVLGGLAALGTVVGLVFGTTGSVLDVGGLDDDGWAVLAALVPVTTISLLLTFALFWQDSEFVRGRRLLLETREATPLRAPSSAAAAAALVPGGAVEAAVGFCIRCGAGLADGGRFCGACGDQVAATS